MTLFLSLVYGIELFICLHAPKLDSQKRPFWGNRFFPHGALLSAPFGLKPAILTFWLGVYACCASLYLMLPGWMLGALNPFAAWLLALLIVLARVSLAHAYRRALTAKDSGSDQDLYRAILSTCAQILVYASPQTLTKLQQISQLSAHIAPTPVENVVSIPSAQVLEAGYLPESAAWIPWTRAFHHAVFGYVTALKEHLFRIADENQQQKERLLALGIAREALSVKLENLERERARIRIARKAEALSGVSGATRRLTLSDYANLDSEELTRLEQEHGKALRLIQRVIEQNTEASTGLFRNPSMGEPVSPITEK
jgi:hypothetical protein